ncbi:MAG TPA: glycosyltransferase [Bacteroidia bacterium]|nr:glycosyltransferase [Bacteroidia bacterium]
MTKSEILKDELSSPIMVSVCVQTYQHANFIEECLNSILMQETSFPFEIILGEDESTDGTRDLCIRIAAQHPEKIKLYLRSRNDVIKIAGKETGRFNFRENLKASKGKYVALCEGDDFWTDRYKLQKQVDFLEKSPDYSICFHKVKILKEGELHDDYITNVPSASTTIYDLAKGNYIHTPSCMFRNGIVLPDWFDEVLAGDFALHILNAQRGNIYCLDETMAVYRVHAGGLWSTNKEENNQLKWIAVLNTLCKHLNGDVKEILAEQRLDWAIVLYGKGYENETKDLLTSELPRLIDRILKLEEERELLMSDPGSLGNEMSGRGLLKALFKKVVK